MASTVSSSVLVRKSLPSTPIKSPYQKFKMSVDIFADDIFFYIDLELARAVLNVDEARLAKAPEGDYPSSEFNLSLLLFRDFLLRPRQIRLQPRRRSRDGLKSFGKGSILFSLSASSLSRRWVNSVLFSAIDKNRPFYFVLNQTCTDGINQDTGGCKIPEL